MHYGASDDFCRGYIDDSTSHKLKSAYWSTKQAVIRRLGKEEDRHIVASDAELDSKLELFKSVQSTCQDFSVCIDAYLHCIFVLSQAENYTGRFLSSRSSDDNTRAGKMLLAVGKALSHSAQQRLFLQNPLSRLEQEVQTFRFRAIADTASTIDRMESARNGYRGALMWMKNISDELDPDMYKKMDKYRRVQMQVKKSKATFDRVKLACMQKVDLLAASRCNMFSHALAAYQNALLEFWERTARTMTAVSNSFKGYQYYEFALLKDLTSESRKLADQTAQWYGSAENLDDKEPKAAESSHIEGKEDDRKGDEDANSAGSSPAEADELPENLLPEEEIDKQLNSLFASTEEAPPNAPDDLLSALTSENKKRDAYEAFKEPAITDASKNLEDTVFLKDLLDVNPSTPNLLNETTSPKQLPTGESFYWVNWDNQMSTLYPPSSPLDSSPQPRMTESSPSTTSGSQVPSKQSKHPFSTEPTPKQIKKPDSNNVEAWMKFFADLTPMGNPDQDSTKQGHVFDA